MDPSTDKISLRWFEATTCMAASRGPPSSSIKHGLKFPSSPSWHTATRNPGYTHQPLTSFFVLTTHNLEPILCSFLPLNPYPVPAFFNDFLPSPAGMQVSVLYLLQLRFFLFPAFSLCIRTSRMESAAGRDIGG